MRERIIWSLRFRQRVDDPIGPRVLPDDGVVPGMAGLRVPDDRRLALVGDADGGEILRRDVGVAHRARDHLVGPRRDLQRIVLDPSGLRQDLLVFELVAGDLVASLVEHHEAGARRSLIDRAYVTGHGVLRNRRWNTGRAPATPPMMGATTGIQLYSQSDDPLPGIGRIACMMRGPRSRAGLIA